MKLKLKLQYEGMRITKNNMEHGKITFDAYSVQPEHYINFYKRGFEELFEEVIEEPKKELLVEDKPKRKNKKDGLS